MTIFSSLKNRVNQLVGLFDKRVKRVIVECLYVIESLKKEGWKNKICVSKSEYNF